LAKTLLREKKRPSEEKEYTRGYKYGSVYGVCSTEIKLEVGYIPCVGDFFPG